MFSNLCAINASIGGKWVMLKITKLLREPNPFVKYLSLHAFICNIAIFDCKGNKFNLIKSCENEKSFT